ncbi:hypothetical protein [Burkholderia glumae]
MSAAGSEPVKLASTARHFNRLRTAWKLGEAEHIRALRLASERARKAGNKEEQTRSLNLALIAAWRLQRDYIGDRPRPRPQQRQEPELLRCRSSDLI